MSTTDKYAWKNFERSLEHVERELKDLDYGGIFANASMPERDIFHFNELPAGALDSSKIDWILSAAALAPPHGLDVLVPLPAPKLPTLPQMPDRALMASYDTWKEGKFEKLKAKIDAVRESVEKNDLAPVFRIP